MFSMFSKQAFKNLFVKKLLRSVFRIWKTNFGKKKILLEIVPNMFLIVFGISFQLTVLYKKKIIKKSV